jgi:hypothetical protein
VRQEHSTITPASVRQTCLETLADLLDWQPFGRRVTVPRLLHLLLLIAAWRSSLAAVVRACRFGFSHETARKAIAANLPAPDALPAALGDGLHRLGRRRWPKRRWDIAIDLHYDPFYGDRRTPGICGGPKKHGSNYPYVYATAVRLHRRHRYTVGLLAVAPGTKPHQVVQTLLKQVTSRGVRLRGVVLDSGFDSGETFRLLQRRKLAYAVPLQRKGRGTNRRNACFALPVGTVQTVAWRTERTRRAVQTRVVVVQGPGAKDVRVLAFRGWGAGRAAARAQLAWRRYRARFGIETSYRQQHQGQGFTTKKDVAYRLLLVGLALLLRQVWVWLTWQIARAQGLRARAWVGALSLARLRRWLAAAVLRRYPERQEIALGQPLLPLPA